MATNFRISVHRNSENLHLKLKGDFDGISAHQLLDILRRYSHRTSRVFIHTSCLGDIHPFGLSVFHNHLEVLKGKSRELVFTGEHALQLAPERPLFFDLTISTVPPGSSPERTVPSPSRVKPE
jgi:anti-anti-sigma regulatory factor